MQRRKLRNLSPNFKMNIQAKLDQIASRESCLPKISNTSSMTDKFEKFLLSHLSQRQDSAHPNSMRKRVRPGRKSIVSLEHKRVRPRLFSQEPKPRNCDLLSEDEVLQCQKVHQNLIFRIQDKVKVAKMARFRGFVSPIRLQLKIQETRNIMKDGCKLRIKKKLSDSPHSADALRKKATENPLDATRYDLNESLDTRVMQMILSRRLQSPQRDNRTIL